MKYLELTEDELLKTLDAIELWLDKITPNDYSWSNHPLQMYKMEVKEVENVREKILMLVE